MSTSAGIPVDDASCDDNLPADTVRHDRTDLTSLLRMLDEPEPSLLDEAHRRTLVQQVTGWVQHHGESLDLHAWAMCSEAYLTVLADAVAAGAYTPHEALVRRLHLTRFALERAGQPRDTVALLDLHGAIDLALAALPAETEAVERAAARWRTLPGADVRHLRETKNLLSPALALARRWGDRRLEAWEPVHPLLP